jgi:alkylhydroperoxidase family enzyme
VLDVRIKELTAVRVGLLNHCRYTVCHRVNSSRNNGIPDEDLLGLLDPDNHDFTDAERAALAFADELTTNMTSVSYADNRQGVSADTLVRLKAHYSDAEISELTLSVSLWNALTRFHRVMDFELDMPEPLAEMITDL